VRRSKSIPNLVVKQTREKACAGCSRPFPLSLKIGFELHLNTIPEILVDDGRMLAGKGLVLVRDLAEVDSVLEHGIECSTGKGVVTGGISGLAQSLFSSDVLLLQINLKPGDASFSEIGLKDILDPIGLLWIDNQVTIFEVIAQRNDSSHPHAFALRRGDLVADTFPCYPLAQTVQRIRANSANSGGTGPMFGTILRQTLSLARDRTEICLLSTQHQNRLLLSPMRSKTRPPVEL
jgi:hypothetical protein